MITKHFTNQMYENAIRKIEDDRAFYINEATEKSDINAIVSIANIKHIRALTSPEYHEAANAYFKNMLSMATVQYVKDGDYDFINKATIAFEDYKDASDFLTCCKLFIKFSSDYELTVNKGIYTFNFNKDRVDEEVSTC